VVAGHIFDAMRARTKRHEIPALLVQTRDADPLSRRRAVQALCPCETKVHDDAVWRRIIDMAGDPDPGVRSLVCHTVCDGSPAQYQTDVLACLVRFRDDDDLKVRKMARRVLAQYRHTGRVNVL
jgi:hypothetical protein